MAEWLNGRMAEEREQAHPVNLSLRRLHQSLKDHIEVFLELGPEGESDVAEDGQHLRLDHPMHLNKYGKTVVRRCQSPESDS